MLCGRTGLLVLDGAPGVLARQPCSDASGPWFIMSGLLWTSAVDLPGLWPTCEEFSLIVLLTPYVLNCVHTLMMYLETLKCRRSKHYKNLLFIDICIMYYYSI